jgi:hypothetical protein
MYEDEDSEP